MKETINYSMDQYELREALMLFINETMANVRIKSPDNISNIELVQGPPQDGYPLEGIIFSVKEFN